jgi:outer membrane murein-binding lipoprotein Lpp
MKNIFFIILIIQTNLTFSQSKKEQIELLIGNIDSLKTVLENERNSNFKKVKELNSAIENFENQISSLKSEVKDAKYNLNQKKLENNQLKNELLDSINYYKNKLNATNQFYEIFLIEQGFVSNDYGVARPVTDDGIKDIGNLKIFTRSKLLNPEAEMGHDFVYKTTSSFYLLRDNAYQLVKLEACFNSNEILVVITNKIKEILKNPDDLDPCGVVKETVKFPLDFESLLFYIAEDRYCFQFAQNSLCGGETEISFSKEEILKYLE